MTNNNFEVKNIHVSESYVTSKGVIVNLCNTPRDATGSYVNAAIWNKEDIETTDTEVKNYKSFVSEIAKEITEVLEKIDRETQMKIVAKNEDIDNKLENEIKNLKSVAQAEKQQFTENSLKATAERKELTKMAIIQRVMEALQAI